MRPTSLESMPPRPRSTSRTLIKLVPFSPLVVPRRARRTIAIGNGIVCGTSVIRANGIWPWIFPRRAFDSLQTLVHSSWADSMARLKFVIWMAS